MVFIDRRNTQQFHIDPTLRKGFKLAEAVVLPNEGEIVVDGESRHLPPKAMEILLFLSQHQNQSITTEQLLLVGWGFEKTKRSNLTHVISEIRHALDDHKECPEYIQTLPRKGYRLIAKVEPLDKNVLYSSVWPIKTRPVAKSGANKQDPNRWHLSLSLQNNSKLFRVSAAFVISTWVLLQVLELLFPIFGVPDWGLKIAVLVLVTGFPLALLYTWLKEIKIRKHLFAKDKDGRRNKHFFKQLAFDFSFIGVLSIGVGFLALHLIESIEVEQGSLPEHSANIPINVPIKNNLIAVLPFEFAESAALPDYFKATFQAEIINALSLQTEFNLVSQRAINELPVGSHLSDYVNRLGARFLLDGHIAGKKDEFSILLSLTDTKNSLQVWSATIAGDPAKLLEAQKELNRQTFNAFSLLAEQPFTMDHVVINTSDFKAYDSYIQGRNKLNTATDMQHLKLAERHFMEALASDPKFSLATAGMCQTYLDQYEMKSSIGVFRAAKEQCSILLSLGQLKASGYVALANLNRISGEHSKAVGLYQQALVLDPEDLNAITGMAKSNSELGQYPQADELFRKVILIEPGYWRNYKSLGDFLFTNGKFKEAIMQYDKVALLRPDDDQVFNQLGAAYFMDYQMEKASEVWSRSLEIKPSATTYSNLATAQYFSHQFEAAVITYQNAVKLAPKNPIIWSNLGDAQKYTRPADSLQSFQKTIMLLEDKLQVNPNDQELLGVRARVHAELGQCTQALATVETLAQKSITDPYTYYDLSLAALRCQQIDKAKLLIEKSLTLGYPLELLEKDIQFTSLKMKNLNYNGK